MQVRLMKLSSARGTRIRALVLAGLVNPLKGVMNELRMKSRVASGLRVAERMRKIGITLKTVDTSASGLRVAGWMRKIERTLKTVDTRKGEF